MSDKASTSKIKQVNALMPNLVHSLDSSALIFLYNAFKSHRIYINFYSVHDCYGVSATDVDVLINLLRNIYIELYSKNKYIETFDKDIIEILKKSLSIKHSNSKIKYDREKRLIYSEDVELLKLPHIPTNKDIFHKDKIKYFNKLKKSILLVN